MTPSARRTRALGAASLAAASLALAGCSALTTDLDGVTETREVAVEDFDRIELNGAADVTVEVGPETSVEVTGDTALLDELRTQVKEGTLSLDGPSWTFAWRDHAVTYAVTVRELDAVALSGAGTLDVSGVDAAHFAVELTGAGDVIVAGVAEHATLALDGAGDIDTSGLDATTAQVDLSGSGDVLIAASEQLDIDLSGAGDVRHLGGAHVDADVSGAGDVAPR